MPSSAHELAVARLRDDPTLLALLAERLLGLRPPHPLRLGDANVRLASPVEVRPDLLFARGRRGAWDAVEVQRRIDRRKARRWATLASVLNDQRRAMGDLWVITADTRVARWARRGCDVVGPSGTTLRLVPIVVLLDEHAVDALLDRRHPALAFFAAWAMHGRSDAVAKRVVERAMEVVDTTKAPLRRLLNRDILLAVGETLDAHIQEQRMKKKDELPPPKNWIEKLADEISDEADARDAAVLRRVVFRLLQARGLATRDDEAVKARLLAEKDPEVLERWSEQTMTATTLDEVFAPRAKKKSPAASTRAGPAAPARRSSKPAATSTKKRPAAAAKPRPRSRAGA